MSKNALVVTLIIAGAIVIVLVTIVIRSGGGIDPATFDSGKRFKAKPGTTRENAMILTSDKRKSTEGPEAAIARRSEEREDGGPPVIKSLSKPKDGPRSGPANDRAQAALNSFSPEAGLRQLEEALALPHGAEQAALLHEAQGQLYAQLDPPDYDKSRAAFVQAIEKAEDPALEEEILYKSVQALMQEGQEEEAGQILAERLTAHPPAGETGYKLQLLQGQLYERAGRGEAAEDAYQAVLNAAQTMPPSLDRSEAIDLVRLAGLRLTNLYRKHDRQQAADGLSRDLKVKLTKMQETG